MEKMVYRIMDVNFNRAREALRVMEEYCRFILNDANLSSRVKEIRHRLCTTLTAVDQERLLSSRDSDNDVGREMSVDGQLCRATLEDCFIAASKRISEALRVLAEVGQTLSPTLYGAFEKMRFEAYSVEKDISLALSGCRQFQRVRLYVLITALTPNDCLKIPDLTKACIDGGADCLQLRCKGLQDKEIITLAENFSKQCRAASVLSIINDRADIALLCGADGVHLGQNDISPHRIRTLQHRPLIIGLSTHNQLQLQEAITSTADYVGLGPVFATSTKPYEQTAGLSYIKQSMEILQKSSKGHVAIGGINMDNIHQVMSLGIRAVAVCSAITSAPKPRQACQQIKQIIESYIKSVPQ